MSDETRCLDHKRRVFESRSCQGWRGPSVNPLLKVGPAAANWMVYLNVERRELGGRLIKKQHKL